MTWIALLRAVNVGRANRVGMERLRASLAALGYADVHTYVQSGNAVFSAPAQPAEAIAEAIHDRLLSDAAVDVGVVVLSAEELARVVRDNPLLAEPGADESVLHTIVLASDAGAARFATLELPAREGERAVLLGRAIHLALPFGMGRTKLTNGYFERALGVIATARNGRTLAALLEMAAGAGPDG